MKIAIDVSQIIYDTGVATYTRNLIANLLKIEDENEYVIFGGSLRRFSEINTVVQKLVALAKKRSVARIYPLAPTMAHFIWNKLHVFPIENLVGKVDVFHSSDWTQPPTRAFKVTTIHDVSPIKFPTLADRKVVSTHKDRLKWVAREVDRVIVPSYATAYDVESLGINKNRIKVIPEAPDPVFKPAGNRQIERIKHKYKIEGKYLLAVGVNERKNTKRIIEAFNGLKKEYSLKMVIIGKPYIKVGAGREVLVLGHVVKNDLPALYSGAEALVYPSLYEGFGLPILEAFSCKTPVVTSNIGSMAEVSGNAAKLVDPKDRDSILDGIIDVLNFRENYIRKGTLRVKTFSWQRTARETLRVYN